MLTLEQALTLLDRMAIAAPEKSAVKLKDIAHLLQSLSNDNQYLVNLYGEARVLPLPETSEQLVVQSPTAILVEQNHRERETTAAPDDLFPYLNDHLQPLVHLIQRCTDGLAEALLDESAAEHVLLIQNISIHANAAKRALDAMSDVMAIRCNALDVTPLVFSTTPIMHDAIRMIESRAQARGHDMNVAYPDVDIQVVGDYQRVLIILHDLLDNAVRYTPEGGTIGFSVESLGTHVLFSVEDTGIGLTADDLDRVGRPFWRASHQPLVNGHPGTGLRLYLARETLALQGGELIFSGDAGRGSTFSFTLPAPG